MKDPIIRGRAWTFGDHINSESIMPTGTDLDPKLAVKHVLEYYDPEFPLKVQAGDFIVGGINFGSSSSRPCGEVLRLVGVGAVICESAGRIFYRNTWNLGVPVILCPGIKKVVNRGDNLEVNVKTGSILNITTGEQMQAEPSIPILLEKWEYGGMVPWIKEHKHKFPTISSNN